MPQKSQLGHRQYLLVQFERLLSASLSIRNDKSLNPYLTPIQLRIQRTTISPHRSKKTRKKTRLKQLFCQREDVKVVVKERDKFYEVSITSNPI